MTAGEGARCDSMKCGCRRQEKTWNNIKDKKHVAQYTISVIYAVAHTGQRYPNHMDKTHTCDIDMTCMTSDDPQKSIISSTNYNITPVVVRSFGKRRMAEWKSINHKQPFTSCQLVDTRQYCTDR